jgi:dTDP-glucose pyrophosphorylase
MTEVRQSELAPTARIAADRTLRQAWESLRQTCAPLCMVDAPGGPAGLPEADVRRALQDGVDPATPAAELAERRLVVADLHSAKLRLAADRSLRAVLVVGRGAAPTVVERVLPEVRDAVVMAGGFGTRLRPLTDQTPKPLLDVGGRPLLCRILDQLRGAGVERVAISVHYLAEQVKAVVRDGGQWGMEVRYLEEPEPLGTGAGLALLGSVPGPFYLLNGDILTDLNLRAFAAHHLLHGNLATVATYLYAAPLPYGVVHHDGERIARIEEKPAYRYPVNAGLYLFAPEVLGRVAHGRPLAMVDFLNEQAASQRIGRFPLIEYWNDVGSHADYERARQEVSAL